MRKAGAAAGLLGFLLAFGHHTAEARVPAAAKVPGFVAALAAPDAREAIARVAWAEAANQGDSGLLAVVYTILNRLADRRWGDSVDQVLNAPRQFEPVMRAGGDWRGLAPASPVQRARIDTLVNLVLDGRLPDPTGGALFFQNPRIVAARAAAGQVSPRLVHFGGAAPSAVIGDHAFYVGRAEPGTLPPPDQDRIFVLREEAGESNVEPARGIFVTPDGSRR